MKKIEYKIRFFLLCWATYVITYLCRVNLSTVLYKLGDGLDVDTAALGMIGSVFFVSYAVGQLINGFMGDRVSPYLFVMLAVGGTALLNFLISMSENYWFVLCCWGFNGYLQSMIWGPLMRLLSSLFPAEKNTGIATGMGLTMIVGYVLTWTVLGQILLEEPWQMYFIIPALPAIGIFLIWFLLFWKKKKQPEQHRCQTQPFAGLINIMVRERLWVVALICFFEGLIRESVNLWAPLLFVKALQIELKSSPLFLMLIPAFNLCGILFTKTLMRRHSKRMRVVIAVQFIITAACAAALTVADSSILSVLLLAVIAAMMSGANCVLLSLIPLSFAKENIVSTLVGIFDFSAYLGAAVASFVLGIILTGENWKPAALVWLLCALVTIGLSAGYRKCTQKEEEHAVELLSTD